MVARSNLIWIVFQMVMWIPQIATAATINVSTDRNPVSINESFQIIFEAEGDLDGEPDFSPLETDFQVLSTVQSSNFSVVNGRISSAKRWTITAMANTAGNISIPSIAFGQDRSPEINLEVRGSTSGPGNNQNQDDIFLEASATPLDPYVQSQVIYTLKLYRSVAIAKASLGEPEVTVGNAVLERIDDDKSYETTINGRSYHVIERNYAVYPQSSGEVTIDPINFMGQITRSRFGLDPFGAPPRTVVRRSQGVTLNVKPIPDSFSGNHWLPAENLTVAEEWSGDPLTLRVGEPITRTLVLTARGLISSQLPELPGWDVTDLKFYPDRAELNDEKSDSGITSTRREKAAIIPNQPGSYVLPEVAIPWWNTVIDRLETAVVPERIIQVLPATGPTNNQNEITSLMLPTPPVLNDQENVITATDAPVLEPGTGDADIWKWTTFLLMVIWLVTIVAWWYRSRTTTETVAPQLASAGTDSVSTLAKKVLAACDKNDPVQVKNHLLAWGRAVWTEGPPVGLGEIALRTQSELSDQIKLLNKVLYSKSHEGWDAGEFKTVFSKAAKEIRLENRSRGDAPQGNLEPLYKI